MRIKLTAEADTAYQAVVEQMMKANPFLDADNGGLISAIVLGLYRVMTPRICDELVQAVSTPESMRRAVLHQIEQASQGMDARALRALEANVRKMSTQTKKSEEKENEIKDVST